MTSDRKLLVLGVGPMAQEYLQACRALSIDATFVGRSLEGMSRFESKTGIRPVSSLAEVRHEDFYAAVIAVNESSLSGVLIQVLRRGFERILVEKPGGSSIDQFQSLADEVSSYPAKVFVAYNRRFYGTVEKLLQVSQADGGIVSIHFDFTERARQVEVLEKDQKTKEDWFFQNSSHVVDLVLHLSPGFVIHQAHASGGLSWHPRASVFSGFGFSNRGVHITYNSVWGPSGGWEVIARSKSLRLVLKPLEALEVTQSDGTKVVYLEEDLTQFPGKAGLAGMLSAFLEEGELDPRLVSWSQQAKNLAVYQAILNGDASVF